MGSAGTGTYSYYELAGLFLPIRFFYDVLEGRRGQVHFMG
jgi:hypothetical protein